MALTDFYVSNVGAFKNACPISLKDTNTLTSGWTAYGSKPNIWYTYFASYAPKSIAEVQNSLMLYGRTYTRMLDLQSLEFIIHGGYYFDSVTKNLYIKCFDLKNPNTTTINISSQQSLEATDNSYYIHRNMSLSQFAGVKFEGTFGLGSKFTNGVNFINQSDFHASLFLVDPEPALDTPVSFPTLDPVVVDGIKFPASTVTYFVDSEVQDQHELAALSLTSFQPNEMRFVNVKFWHDLPPDWYIERYVKINWVYRYEPTANEGNFGDIKPTGSNGTGTPGNTNGWWIRVFGVELERVINSSADIAALKSLSNAFFADGSLRRVTSNGKVYKYVRNASAGNVKPNTGNGTGVGDVDNGWWVEVTQTELNDLHYVLNANHFSLSFHLSDTNQLSMKHHMIQEKPEVFELPTITLTKGSFKFELELFPRTGSVKVLNYTLKMTPLTSLNQTVFTPAIYTGEINGIPSNGNIQTFLVGFGLSEGAIIDDLVISEILESA